MLAQLRNGAPRSRFGALIVVGLIVVGLLAYAATRPDVIVTGWVTPAGELCVGHDARMWTSADTVVAPGTEPVAVQGTWSTTGPQTAELTTPSGRTISLHTDQPDDDDWRDDNRVCALTTR
jgi:hypothetical protein